jgi:4-carboxymuconolactone decarboxylase
VTAAMSRLPDLRFDELTPEQKRVYDEIAGTRRAVRGPFAIWLTVPDLAERALQLQKLFNYESRIEKRLMQLMMITTARLWSAQFAWFIHAEHALKLGIAPEVVEAIRDNKDPPFARDDERLVYDLVTELNRDKTLSDATYARAEAMLGRERLVELVAAAGFYVMVAMTLNAFDAPVPDGSRPLP